MSRRDRFRVRLQGRLRVRLRGRLRIPGPWTPSPAFPCIQAAFRGCALCDISTSAGASPVPRPLTGDALRLVPWPSRWRAGRWLLAWADLAVRCLLGLLVTWAWRVLLACRVVASRRCSVARTRLVVPADAVSVRCALAGQGCTAQPSLSRRLADAGWRAARRRSARPGMRRPGSGRGGARR